MCRYVAYLGEPLLLSKIFYEPSNSLVHQASEAMESRTRVNADGFGVGWYHPELSVDPAVFKDVSPAWNNANLRSLSTTVSAHCILAHVRAARRFDQVSRSNCHPFQCGRLLWMHNGDIPGRARLHRRVVCSAREEQIARIVGNTDSELAFCLFLTLLGDREPGADTLAATMERTIEQILAWYGEDGDDRPLVLNFCVTDGEVIVAVRFALDGVEAPSLHLCQGRRFVCENGVCRMHDGDRRCVMLASEALSEDAHWVTVPDGTLVIARSPEEIEMRRLSLGPGPAHGDCRPTGGPV